MRTQKTPLGEYKSLLPYFSRYRRQYFGGILCLLVVDGAQIIIPQFLRRAVDLISLGDFVWKEIVVLALLMIALMALIAAGRFLWRYFIHGSSRRIETELRETMFAHLSKLSWDFYQKNKIGDLMARSISDLNVIRMAVSMGIVALLDFIFMATSILIIIFVQDPRSALFSVLPLPLVTLLILFFGSMVGRKFHRVQEIYSKMSDTAQETFAGIRVIKSFVKEWWFIKKFAANNDDYRKANMELVQLFGFFFPFVTFLSELTVLIMLVIGGGRVITGQMSPGSLVALFRYLQMLIWPLMGAGFTVNMIQRGAVSLGRVNEILRTVPSIGDIENPATPPFTTGPAIEIRHLTAVYGGGETVLNDINLVIDRGEWLGIMGRVGSGKSTLIKTFTRMIDPPAGTVFVFGLDVRQWALADLRSRFAVSPQDSYLFSDSIANNIAYGLDSADPDMIKSALEAASLEKDIGAFAEGKDTTIGERGLTLSGGQKQRTAIARALIMDSDFLILDDSLSAVDAETERNILEALFRLRKERRGKTTIIVSHRVSALRYADKILVLEKGAAGEYGSPAELAANSAASSGAASSGGGYYARMAALQRLEPHG